MSLGLGALLALGALNLSWETAEACPAPDVSTLTDGSARVLLRRPSELRWELVVEFLEPFVGSRALTLTTCDDARRAARALLQLGLEGAPAFAAAELPPAPLPPPAPAAPSPAPPPTLVLRLGASLALVALPLPTGRFWAAAGVRWRSLELELAARLGTAARIPGGPVATAAVRAWPAAGLELTSCWAPTTGAWRFGLCASALGEWWTLEGEGVSNPLRGAGPYLALGPAARVALGLGAGFSVGLHGAARLSVVAPAAAFGGAVALRAGVAIVEMGLGVGWSPTPR